MPLKSLEHLATRVVYETLPANWNTFDLARFSPAKDLWDYQQQALKLALAVLFKYYEEFDDFATGQDAGADKVRKAKMVEWYQDGMLLSPRERQSLDLSLARTKLALRSLVTEYFPLDEDAPVIDFADLCNRMGFWMATGSGKTIVLVKLLEILHLLMRRAEIPVCDVLMLTHREDLIEQFQRTIAEYNHAPDAPAHIELRELREYPEAKRETPGGLLGRDTTLRVFYYRSDNVSDEHKERIVDFRNYDNEGRWYVLLDEAHKGVAEDSKRKHIYTILSRAGFLFNFSATFTDTLDLATTVHNFNLSEFIERGYGKHIAVLRQELAAFKKRGGTGDYSDDEKRKVVAKSMLLLAYTARKVRELRTAAAVPDLYHHPMLLTLVNSVNTEDADLKLYFQQVLAIGRGEVPLKIWNEAKAELWEELKDEPPFLYEINRKVAIAKADIDALSVRDVWREVYNFESEGGGDIEVLVRPGNHQEIAFKMKTSPRPFALIKIGDITDWLRSQLTGFDYQETLESESFFTALNNPESSINILMGSRTFYEGWDSNRPNVINFVNIGTGEDAKKFILQSVGRGVRVQSWNRERRRFEELIDAFDDKNLFRRLRPLAVAPETLYVLGTNREALQVVLEELKKEKPAIQDFLKLDLNPDATRRLLLVPQYRDHGLPLIEERAPSKFEIGEDDFSLLDCYGNAVVDDRVLLLAHGSLPRKVQHFRDSLIQSDTYYAKHSARSYRNLDVMVGRVMDYFGLRAKELDRIRALEQGKDIVHFQRMSVDKPHAEEIQRRVDRVLFSQTPEGIKEREAIEDRYNQGEFDFTEAARLMEDRGLTGRQTYNDELNLEYLANHYYLPAVYSKGKRLDYIRHIIDTDSEVRFLNALRDYTRKPECVLRGLDWWTFSKLDQYLDTPFIPYYDPKQNRIARFIPDFIFWGQKGDTYTILFLDPKGMEQVDWERKIDGYRRLFEDATGKILRFDHEGVKVTVRLFLYTKDRNVCPEGNYKRFWMDQPVTVFKGAFEL
ncbi:MAG TPA: DEAD/DEAH box helicase family protein [Candidatus Acidoferrum sp.]|nr:DEAD/DEAH box helicase family protein [Candidatus Acidoferrum sp.]